MAKDKFNYITTSYANAGGHGYGSLPKVVIPFWEVNGRVAPNGNDSNCSVWCSTGALDTYCCQYQRPRK